MRMLLIVALLSIAATGQAGTESGSGSHPVLELRQYRIVPGKRDEMIDLFEHKFIESQEVLGMRLVGTFRDLDDPNRFVWLRAFSDMRSRGSALGMFYFGPVWRENRGTANPLLDDNDNVLLLRPAYADSGFGPPDGTRAAIGAPAPPAGLVVTTIFYLWKEPDEGFTKFFQEQLAPAYVAAGLPVLGAYVREKEPNNFPQLVVREGERVFVWFTRVADQAAYDKALAALKSRPTWRNSIGPTLKIFEEREPQVLRLAPSARSMLR